MKPNGSIWISGTYHSIYACGYALQIQGFRMLNDVAWYKPNAAPNLGCRMFTASHETLIWASKNMKSKHVFNYSEMREGSFPNDFIKNPGKQMRSVWSITTPGKSEKIHGKHPTQKPLSLLDRVIRASSNPGDTVLDPFCGSATTGVAAVLNGREFVGIDADEKRTNSASHCDGWLNAARKTLGYSLRTATVRQPAVNSVERKDRQERAISSIGLAIFVRPC